MVTGEELERYLQYAERIAGNRIYLFLMMLEQESVYDFSEQSPYEESILSREVKAYFRQYAEGTGDDSAFVKGQESCNSVLQYVYSFLQLDEFERMCMELAVLGEVNPNFEKFFIYANNDWNNGYLTIDTAIRLYTLKRETDIHFYRYFTEDSSLVQFVFSLYGQKGKGRVRWGLKLRNSLFQLLFAKDESFSKGFPFLKWCYAKKDGASSDEVSVLFQQIDCAADKDLRCIYLCGEEEGDKQTVEAYGGVKGHDICFIDIRQFVFLLEKNTLNITFSEFLHDILLKVGIKDAWICAYYCDSEFLRKECVGHMIREMVDVFLEKGIFLFIIGEKSCSAIQNDKRMWELSDQTESGDLSVWQKKAEIYSVEEDVGLNVFANTYHFTAVQIERVFQNAEKRRILDKRDVILWNDIKEACINETGRNANSMITVMNTGFQWEDLVLPDRQKEQLKMACDRVLYKHKIYNTWGFGGKIAYGRGVSMVFSGPPGTGKTMTAGIVAGCLGTTLYRVDLAAVVSKYIGETEKNLNAVFEAVKKGQGVLFFDEADVLFGRRTEVQNSNDKHSNMEAAYLLQKIEEYEGIVILATNYMQNIDEAFKRRIQFVIEFPFPDEACRKELWKKVFPKQVEFDGVVDYDFLAEQFELSGSHIKNIALQAAFFAADVGKGICMEHIIRALLLEVRKTGKRISREDLREYHIYYENI